MALADWGLDKSWTLFLDRDGVINQRTFGGYVLNVESFHFSEGALTALSQIKNYFGRTVVVTNQQCVGLGLITLEDLNLIHQNMVEVVSIQGGKIDAVYAAIDLRNSSVGNRRKPNSNMAHEAKTKFPEIDFSKSIMIGDTDSDVIFGQNLGMRTVLIKSKEKVIEKADLEFDSLLQFIELL